MHLATIATALLLPLVALAEEPTTTTTCTTTMTLTQTITLKRVASTTFSANATSLYNPTGSGASTTLRAPASTTTASTTASPSVKLNGGALVGPANMAVVAIGGAVVAWLL
ncbi:hypothetical protein GQ53DRAFT_828054 [Thozetella sp. PMI_491]|nr:hypothetical protein GQ53DRAFT_828054 [Thozetella sp. PMI_491]